MNYYGYPPGYDPIPAKSANQGTDASRYGRARLDGGQWISRDGETIYHFRFGDYWRAHWGRNGFGAWERSPGLPEGAIRL